MNEEDVIVAMRGFMGRIARTHSEEVSFEVIEEDNEFHIVKSPLTAKEVNNEQ